MPTYADHGAQPSHDGSTISISYSPAPGSPTLTNPDMILPDYDDPCSPDRSESPLTMWRNAQSTDLQYQASLHSPYIAGPATPTTPIIYGNGTMLSDIGEVTEVESTPGKPLRSTSPHHGSDRRRQDSDGEIDVPHLSKRHDELPKRSKTHRYRSSSVDSNSTVTTMQDHAHHFADFDDAISVDDSNFQGDDEESIAESTAEDMTVRQTKFLPQPHGVGLDSDNRHSAVSISERAEEILANAKRRLTVRYSFLFTP